MDEDATVIDLSDLVAEPFASALTEAEAHLERDDYPSAKAIYEELLALAESFADEPDIRFMRGHLLANIAMLTTEHDLGLSEQLHNQALELLRGLRSEPKGPIMTQLWLDMMLKALTGQASVFHKRGELPEALALLDEGALLLPEFSGDGTRLADLNNTRAGVLVAQGAWNEAEELVATTLATTPESVSSVPYLRTTLGLIYGETGRFDLADDTLVQAGEEFLALGMAEEPAHLVAHRGEVAMRRGHYARAAEMYLEAAERFERRGEPGNLAMCEQALGLIEGLRGNIAEAAEFMNSSLEGLREAGLAVSAAASMVFASQQAYGRGDMEETVRLGAAARAVFEERGLYEQCARADYLQARCIEDGLVRDSYGEHKKEALEAALWLAVPAALTLEAARYDFATSHARSQWLALSKDAMRLVFNLARISEDPGLMFELVEFRCAGTPLVRTAALPESVTGPVFPDAAMKTYEWADGTDTLGGTAAEAAAAEGLRVALPPKVLLAPENDRTALREFIEVAESRYHRKIVSDETVDAW